MAGDSPRNRPAALACSSSRSNSGGDTRWVEEQRVVCSPPSDPAPAAAAEATISIGFSIPPLLRWYSGRSMRPNRSRRPSAGPHRWAGQRTQGCPRTRRRSDELHTQLTEPFATCSVARRSRKVSPPMKSRTARHHARRRTSISCSTQRAACTRHRPTRLRDKRRSPNLRAPAPAASSRNLQGRL